MRELDPDVLTGWNVVDFDLSVLDRLAGRHGVPLELGRGPGALRLRAQGGTRGARQATIPGRVVLDGIHLLRGAFVRMDDYGLDAVARSVLGEGKTLAGRGRAEEILRLFEEDRERLVEYNRTDARLALEVLERLRLVELAVERSRLTGLPLDRVASSIAAFDFLYLSELGRRGIVAPSVRAEAEIVEPQGGGHVLEPLPGLYTNVVVLDFKSLYPSLIRTFEIDPLNLVRPEAGQSDADPIVAPNGAAFARRKGILSELLDELLPRREEARRAGDSVKSHAIKILMNSFYGVLGTPACRFYDPRLANAITSFGREVLLWCQRRIEAEGRRVLYGDTDSLFVETGETDAAAARALRRDARRPPQPRPRPAHRGPLARRRAASSSPSTGSTCGSASPPCATARRGRASATPASSRRRTARASSSPAWRPSAATGRISPRTSSGSCTRGSSPTSPSSSTCARSSRELRQGRFDDRLVYRKSLRKAPEAYTATTPPHVAAARKMAGKRRGRVAYVITTDGPEPADDRRHPIDHEHYVERQLRAVAEPVLALLGQDFDDVSGSRKQLSLF